MFSNGPHIVTDGLVLCLDAGDKISYPGSGTTWYDLSPEGNNGTLSEAGIGTVSGSLNTMAFDGADDKITLDNTVEFDLSGGMTISFWITHDRNTNGAVLGLSGHGTNSYIQPHQNGNIYFEPSDDSNTAYAGMSYDDTSWHNYVMTVDNYAVIFYEDNVNITSDGVVDSDVDWSFIGSTGSKWFTGNIATLLMYNRTLSASEISQNFNAQRSRFGV
jgi:hypothetical protein